MSRVPSISVAVTGAAGQISYSLLFDIASGAMFGPDQPVSLRLIEIEPALKTLEGVAMELEDCAFPLLSSVEMTSDLHFGFNSVNWAILVGAVPRKAGMERRDLLGINGSIFGPQGLAISSVGASDVRVLVVGNPCNTNALIAREAAKDLPANRFFSMTRLDQNRAVTQLALKAGVSSTSITNLAIWGNHSSTQFPDFTNAKIDSKPVEEIIRDKNWLRTEFLETVQSRGAAIISARGASSAASAAQAIVDSVRSVISPTPPGDCVSLAVPSNGEYGIPKGLQFGFPVTSDGKDWKIVDNFELDNYAKSKIDASAQELLGERAEVASLVG